MPQLDITELRRRGVQLLAWLRSADGLAYLALMAIALGVRLYLAPRVITSADLLAYEYWGELANTQFLHVYSASLAPQNWAYYAGYPPIAVYLYGLLDKVYFGLGALLGIPLIHDVRVGGVIRAYLKLPAIFADIALLTILYVKALKAMPRWAAWLLSVTYALSPGIIITVIFWGQTDGIVLLLTVAALIFAMRKQPIWCGVMLALAINFKPQPIVFVPLALVYLWRWGGFRLAVRAVIAMAVVTIVVWIPYLLPPHPEALALAHNISLLETAEGLTATHTAWNLWYALGIPKVGVATQVLGPLTLSQVGDALFLLVILIALVGVWRDPRPVRMWAGAAIIALAFFTVMTLQFERYLFPALALFFLAALYDRRYWPLYFTVSITFMANFASELFSCACDAYTTRLSGAMQYNLVLHLDPWQTGVINCIALVVAIAFFLWPRAEQSEQDKQNEQFLAQPVPMLRGEGVALAPSALRGDGR
jgi:hypothetical protein